MGTEGKEGNNNNASEECALNVKEDHATFIGNQP